MSESLADHVATQLRVEMARQAINALALAGRIGVSEMWVSRRMRGKTQVTMADLERIAVALDVPLTTFVPQSVAS